MSIKTKIYPSGLRLVVDEKQGYESISVYNYIGVGSKDEDETNRGISHFIEHMLFKGTKTRSSKQIMEEFDNLGSSINAYTTTCQTAINVKAISETIEPTLEILSDVWLNSVFDEKELEKERKVVLEEIEMNDDDSQTLAFNVINELVYKNTPYEYEIAGTKESVNNITREQMLAYIKKQYTPAKTILSFSGDITLEQADQLVKKYYEKHLFKKYGSNKPVLNEVGKGKHIIKSAHKHIMQDREQTKFVIGLPSFNIQSKHITALNMLSEIIGGGLGSRIYNTLSDDLGLSYQNYAFIHSNNVGGYFGIYVSCSTKNVVAAINNIQKILFDVATNGVTKKEFNKAKISAIINTKFSIESTDNMADSHSVELGKTNIVKQKEEALKEVTDIDFEKFNKLAKQILLTDNVAIASVGQKEYKLFNIFKKGFNNSVSVEEEFEATA